MNWQTILCLGDSITIGSRSHLGYPEHCCGFLKRSLGQHWNALNFATAGHRAIDLARDMDRCMLHLRGQQPGVATILVGTNDAKHGTPQEDFSEAYEQILVKARSLCGHDNIVALTIPELFPGMLYPYTPAMNAIINGYNHVILDRARDHGLRVFTFDLEPGHFFDGVHLNNTGARIAGKQLSDLILKDKLIAPAANMP